MQQIAPDDNATSRNEHAKHELHQCHFEFTGKLSHLPQVLIEVLCSWDSRQTIEEKEL